MVACWVEEARKLKKDDDFWIISSGVGVVWKDEAEEPVALKGYGANDKPHHHVRICMSDYTEKPSVDALLTRIRTSMNKAVFQRK